MANSFLTSMTVSSFINQTTDQGSGATTDISFWTPNVEAGYYSVGLYATNNYNTPPAGFQNTYLGNDDAGNPCLMTPTGFAEVWTCSGNGGDCFLGIYAPIAPDGYVALGCVATSDFTKGLPTPADFPNVMCVRQDLCTPVTLTIEENLIYADHGDKCTDDVTVFMLPNSQTAYAVSGYPTTVPAYDIILPLDVSGK